MLFFVTSINAQYSYDLKVNEELMMKYEEEPGSAQRVFLVHEEQFDAFAYVELADALNTPSDIRKVAVVEELKALASRTQVGLMADLQNINDLDLSSVISYWVFNGLEMELTEAQAREVSKIETIQAIELVQMAQKYDDSEMVAMAAVEPNGHENGHEVIRATELWALGYTGYGISSFTIDTGVNPNHPAIKSHYRGNVTGMANSSWYEGSTGEDPYDCDDEYHGTHVTGTIMGLDRMNDDTIGVAFNANWLGAATIECSGASTAGAFQFAMDPDGNSSTADAPDVINNSWGFGPGSCQFLSWQFTLNNIYGAGIANVFAAGNYGPDSQTVGSPAQFLFTPTHPFAVGNLNGYSSTYQIAPSSSRGPSICSGSADLRIKPEVSAPGVNVRSCVGDNQYADYTGTSMATPQVAGGICLLKEAFPQATGVEITEAIYQTAIDLGTNGEDNVYGNGLVDLMAAFEYLENEGFVAIDPSVGLDLHVFNLNVNSLNCAYGVESSFYVQNSGTQNVESFDYTIEFNGLELTESWTGVLAPGDKVMITPSAIFPDAGTAEFSVSIDEGSVADERILNNRQSIELNVIDKSVLSTTMLLDDAACEGSQQSVFVESDLPYSYDVNWFTNFDGSSSYGSGNPLNLELSEDLTLYAQPFYTANVGETDVEGDWSFDAVDSKGLEFSAEHPFKLRSVLINAQNGGFLNVRLKDAAGNTLNSKLAPVTPGIQRFDLNFDVPKGNAHKLVIIGNLVKLSVFEDGVDFPYLIDDVVRIYKSEATSFLDEINKYFFFYDWIISFEDECPPLPVEFSVNGSGDGPAVSFTASNTEVNLSQDNMVSFTQNVEDGSDFEWDFGNGVTSNEANPTYGFTQQGDYVVTLTATKDGCSSVYAILVKVRDMVSSSSSISNTAANVNVFPNPVSNGSFTVESSTGKINGLELFSIEGKSVLIRSDLDQNNINVNTGNLPSGIYFLRVKTDSGLTVKKLMF